MSTAIYQATYSYDDEGFYNGILYGNASYVWWGDIADAYFETGVIGNSESEMYPYYLVEGVLREKIYISDTFLYFFIQIGRAHV